MSVPVAPQRVIALTEIDLDATLALGMKPVGTINGRGQPTAPRYLTERAAGIELVGTINQPDLEKITKLNPDVILAGGMPDEQLALLRQVAPAVVTYKAGDNWKTHLRQTASALNKEAAAGTFLADYDRRVQSVKAKLGPNAGAEVSVVRWNPTGPGYMLTGSFASLVLNDLVCSDRPDSNRTARAIRLP